MLEDIKGIFVKENMILIYEMRQLITRLVLKCTLLHMMISSIITLFNNSVPFLFLSLPQIENMVLSLHFSLLRTGRSRMVWVLVNNGTAIVSLTLSLSILKNYHHCLPFWLGQSFIFHFWWHEGPLVQQLTLYFRVILENPFFITCDDKYEQVCSFCELCALLFLKEIFADNFCTHFGVHHVDNHLSAQTSVFLHNFIIFSTFPSVVTTITSRPNYLSV